MYLIRYVIFDFNFLTKRQYLHRNIVVLIYHPNYKKKVWPLFLIFLILLKQTLYTYYIFKYPQVLYKIVLYNIVGTCYFNLLIVHILSFFVYIYIYYKQTNFNDYVFNSLFIIEMFFINYLLHLYLNCRLYSWTKTI